jgi:hypothetical protein
MNSKTSVVRHLHNTLTCTRNRSGCPRKRELQPKNRLHCARDPLLQASDPAKSHNYANPKVFGKDFEDLFRKPAIPARCGSQMPEACQITQCQICQHFFCSHRIN